MQSPYKSVKIKIGRDLRQIIFQKEEDRQQKIGPILKRSRNQRIRQIEQNGQNKNNIYGKIVAGGTEINISGSGSNEIKEFLTDSVGKVGHTSNSFGSKSKTSSKLSQLKRSNSSNHVGFQVLDFHAAHDSYGQ